MEKYPILFKIRQRLGELNKTMAWLAGEINMSVRWIEKITAIETIYLGNLMELSRALEFDFIADYYKWIGKGIEAPLPVLNEPHVVYKKGSSDKITLALTMRGGINDASKMLQAIQKEGQKLGYVID